MAEAANAVSALRPTSGKSVYHARSFGPIRPALAKTGWKKPSSLVQGWGAVQVNLKLKLTFHLDHSAGADQPQRSRLMRF
jgi:hypothetical protein